MKPVVWVEGFYVKDPKGNESKVRMSLKRTNNPAKDHLFSIRVNGKLEASSLEALLMAHDFCESFRKEAASLERDGKWFPVRVSSETGKMCWPSWNSTDKDVLSWHIRSEKAGSWSWRNSDKLLTLGPGDLVVDDTIDVWLKDVYDLMWYFHNKWDTRPELTLATLNIKDITSDMHISDHISTIAFSPELGFGKTDNVDPKIFETIYMSSL